MTTKLTALALIILTVGCQDSGQLSSNNDTLPSSATTSEASAQNIILLIGDGMGLTQVSSAFYYKDTTPNFKRFDNIGLIRTSSTSKITDSAAGATAFSTGKKSYNGAIGVDSAQVSHPTILEILSDRGWQSGAIATSSITHATPASFFAHVPQRSMAEQIALHLSESSVDFFAGGGLQFFQEREDEIDLLESLRDSGFVVATDVLPENTSPDNKYAFLLADNGMPRMLDGRGDFLPDATRLALDYFGQTGDQFFLVVEGSQIDWGGHANEEDYLVSELNDFDNAIGVALDFAEKDGNTLVVVTADHETGGYTLSSNNGNYDDIKGTFSTGGHSTTLIPVFAYGPGSDAFRGVYENTEIFDKMMAAAGPETP